MVTSSATIAATLPRRRKGLSVGLWRVLLLLALVALWEFYARVFADPVMIAPPSHVFVALGPRIFFDPRIVSAIGITLYELSVAFGLSVVVGIAIGVAIGLTDFGRRSMMPIVLLIYAIPQVILLPLFILIFGIGPTSKIAFGFSHGVLPIIVNTVAGMQGVNQLFLRSAQSMGAGQAQTIRYILFPHMVTAVFAGLRLSMTMTMLGVLLAELFVSISGIGYFAQVFAETFDPAPLFALIATLACMAVALNEIVRRVELRFTRWKE